MTLSEAKTILRYFYDKQTPSEDDIFLFTEACQFLIEETKDPRYVMELGGYYYEMRQFDLALKYYELAASYKHPSAYECLGYVWYYGRTGTKDYEKAFHYFSLGKESGNIVCAYKLADMYKNGYFVEKDYEKYKEIIEDLYDKVKFAQYTNEPLPEIFTRLARIRKEEGKTDEAIDLYLRAKEFLTVRIKYHPFFGNLNIMMWLVDDLYTMIPFDPHDFDLFDCYYLLTNPHCITFRYGGKAYTIHVVEDEEEFGIQFGNRWYHTREDFFQNATARGQKLTAIADDLYQFEVK